MGTIQTSNVATAANAGSVVSVTTTSSKVISANPSRLALIITNNDPARVITLKAGTGTAVSLAGINLQPKMTVTLDIISMPYSGEYNAVTDAGDVTANNLSIVEI